MKIILKIAILLFINTVFAQKENVAVEYTFYDNLYYKEREVVLISNNIKSICKTKYDGNIKGNNKPILENGRITIGGEIADKYQVIDKREGVLYEYRSFEKKIVKVEENTPIFQWNLNHEETKKINDYICHKATVDFRGRLYNAWFTKDIPIFSGPWKFNGLPGLILEVEDITKTYKWEVKTIKYPSSRTILIPYNKVNEISLVNYINDRAKTLEKQRARVLAALPRGAEAYAPKDYRKGLEKIYEWEEINE